MKNILLINPPGISLGHNNGLCYLSAYLKINGFNTKIIDLLNQPGNEDQRLMLAKDYDVIGISVKTLIIDEAVRIMDKVKKINPKAILICGGVHISLDGFNFMKENEIFDFGFINESENSLLDLLRGKNPKEIDGIIYRKDDQIISNPKQNFVQDLDELPLPDFDSFDIPITEIKNYPLITSRGCPYNCTYCTVQAVNKKWRPRSVESLIRELKTVRPRIHEFHIVDDNFTLQINRVKEFCRQLIRENLNLRWSCPNGIRADILDPELVSLMKQSGCYLVNLGIESANEAVFKNIQKGETLEEVKQAIKMLKKEKIGVIGNFIIGLPGSTYEIDLDSVRAAKNMGLDVSLWYPLSIYPHTEVYNQSMKDPKVKFIRDWKEGFRYNFNDKPILSFERQDYTAKEMIKMFYFANLQTRSYGILIDPKKPLYSRAADLIKIILKYDPRHLFSHSFNALKILIKYRKVY